MNKRSSQKTYTPQQKASAFAGVSKTRNITVRAFQASLKNAGYQSKGVSG